MSVMLLGSLLACSHTSSSKKNNYSITKANIMITDDSKLLGESYINGKDGKDVNVKPKALYYEFKMKKDEKNKFTVKSNEDLEVIIIPDKDLRQASIDTVGFDIFKTNHSKYSSGMGFEDFGNAKKAKIEVYYELGATVKNNEIPLAPSNEKLEKLKKVASHGTLVIKKDNREIGRYSLETLRRIERYSSN
ncbi:hypothetical protein CN918_30850 [Priestia megaterium]|nr:hypothetical protein CN918_30850 [Priestia megaterium]